MSGRAMWKGVLRFGDARVPVKLYAAVKERGIHFRLLHRKDHTPVRQQMVNPETGDPVPYAETERGYLTEEGEIVVLREADLRALQPRASRDIQVEHFLPAGAIGHRWYDRPYFLGPDGQTPSYFALVEALRRSGREGIARWVMRKQDYMGALRVHGDHLALVTLRWAEEVVVASGIETPGARGLSAKELSMAKQLVAMLEDDLDLGEYRDEYSARVLEYVEKKAKGRTVRLRKPAARRRPTDLSAALRASLTEARKVA
jgi:DNA end-binding protein Ku